MAFVPHYKHDVFISYSRFDNKKITYGKGEQIEWVSQLKNALQIWINKKLGKSDVTIWMDINDLPGNESITKALNENVINSATFIVILSKGYVNSAWCLQELDAFINSPSSDGRLFVACLDKFNPDQKPDQLKELLGYTFYDEEGETLSPDESAYNKSLCRLRDELCDKLIQLKENHQIEELILKDNLPATSKNASTFFFEKGNLDTSTTLFLAEGNSDVEEDLKSIRTYFTKQGYTVLPRKAYPYAHEDYCTELEADLAQANLFVQLLGQWHRPDRHELPNGVETFLYERARAANLETLQGCSCETYKAIKDKKIKNEAYWKFLNASNIEALDLEDFKELINERLNRLTQLNQKKFSLDFDQSLEPIIIYAQESDKNIAYDIQSILGADGYYITIYFWDKDKKLIDIVNEEQLNPAGLILVYGESAQPLRIRDGIGAFNKIKIQRKTDELLCALYFDPPSKKNDQIPTTIPNYIIQFDKNNLDGFRQSVRDAKKSS
jgi:hypothetical protein